MIEAREHLSVQVHPSGPGATKHECWVVLEPPAAGVVYAGLGENGDPAGAVRSAAAARAEDVDEHLLALEVAAGDAIILPSGIVHALTAGALVYEVSEGRDVTYRIHDWGRRGRPVHVDEAAAAARPIVAARHAAPAAPGAHPVPLPAGFPFAVTRHVGPCAVEARRGRAYTRLAGPGRGETFVVDGPAPMDLSLGVEIAEAFTLSA
jgi:hypothetical protein